MAQNLFGKKTRITATPLPGGGFPASIVGISIVENSTIVASGGGDAAQALSVGSINAGPWGVGQEMNIVVFFGVNITVAGSPSVTLDINGTSKDAVYKSGSGTKQIVFGYNIESGVNAAASEFALTSPIQMNGGSMKDGSDVDIDATFTPPNTSSVVVDTVPPTILDVSAVGSGPWITGSNLDFDVHISKNVYVSTTNGAPHINFTLNGVAKTAVYISGSESAHLIFRYVVQDGDTTDPGGLVVESPLSLY